MRKLLFLIPVVLFLGGCATLYVPREEVERMKLEVENLRKAVARLTQQNIQLEKERNQLYQELKNVSQMFQQALQEERKERESLKAQLAELKKLTRERKKVRKVVPRKVAIPSSEKIKMAQKALKNAGFDPGPIDGKLGPLTTRALREFQKYFRLPVTGKLDDKTWQLLKEYLSEEKSLK